MYTLSWLLWLPNFCVWSKVCPVVQSSGPVHQSSPVIRQPGMRLYRATVNGVNGKWKWKRKRKAEKEMVVTANYADSPPRSRIAV